MVKRETPILWNTETVVRIVLTTLQSIEMFPFIFYDAVLYHSPHVISECEGMGCQKNAHKSFVG